MRRLSEMAHNRSEISHRCGGDICCVVGACEGGEAGKEGGGGVGVGVDVVAHEGGGRDAGGEHTGGGVGYGVGAEVVGVGGGHCGWSGHFAELREVGERLYAGKWTEVVRMETHGGVGLIYGVRCATRRT